MFLKPLVTKGHELLFPITAFWVFYDEQTWQLSNICSLYFKFIVARTKRCRIQMRDIR